MRNGQLIERWRRSTQNSLADFNARFREGALPDDMPEVKIPAEDGGLLLVQALKQANSGTVATVNDCVASNGSLSTSMPGTVTL